MIPGKIVRFLERANVSHAGTRDRDLVPHGHRVSGWTVGADARTLTILVPETARPHLIESLEDNGQFSVTIEEYPPTRPISSRVDICDIVRPDMRTSRSPIARASAL